MDCWAAKGIPQNVHVFRRIVGSPAKSAEELKKFGQEVKLTYMETDGMAIAELKRTERVFEWVVVVVVTLSLDMVLRTKSTPELCSSTQLRMKVESSIYLIRNSKVLNLSPRRLSKLWGSSIANNSAMTWTHSLLCGSMLIDIY